MWEKALEEGFLCDCEIFAIFRLELYLKGEVLAEIGDYIEN